MTTSTTTATAVDETRARNVAINERVIAAGCEVILRQNHFDDDNAAEVIAAALMELATAWREEAAWWENSGRRGAKGTAKELTQAAARLAGVAVGLKAAQIGPGAMDAIAEADAQQIIDLTRLNAEHGSTCVRCAAAGHSTTPCRNAACEQAELHPEPCAVCKGFAEVGARVAGFESLADAQAKLESNTCAHPVAGLSTLKSGAVKCTTCGSTIKEGDPTMAFLAGETNTYNPGHQVGDKVTVGGVEFTKISDDPFPSTPQASEIAAAFASTMPNPFTSPGLPRRPAPKRLTFDELGPLIGATYPAPRPNLSHSAIERYAGCGVALLLSDATRAGVLAAQRPSWSRVGGQAFHLAIESIERAVLANGGSISDTAVTEEFWQESLGSAIEAAKAQVGDSPYVDDATWHIANSGREGYDWWRVEGLEMVRRYVAFHDNTWRATHTLLQLPTGPNGGAPYEPVLEFEYQVPAGTTAISDHGFIDAAWVDLSDPKVAKLDIHDYKAGKSKPDSNDQLHGYASALRRLLPANFALPVRGTYWLARQGVYTPPVTLDVATSTARVDYAFKMTKRGVDAGVFVPRVSSFCVSCSAVDLCPARA